MMGNYIGLIAKKCGMSYIMLNSQTVPVTILKLDDMYIVDVKTVEKNGYNAVVVATNEVKQSKCNKSQRVTFEKIQTPFLKTVKEFRLFETVNMSSFTIGQKIDIDLTKLLGFFVDTRSVAKGKGFAGVVKKYGFGGQLGSHGESLSERSLGSTGNRTDPGKVFKNKKMPSRMGGKSVNVQNMEIIKVDTDNSLIFLKGTVPGFNSSDVFITNAIKKSFIMPGSKSLSFNFIQTTFN